jgi:hypothetical protein
LVTHGAIQSPKNVELRTNVGSTLSEQITINFRKEKANEIRAQWVKKNYQIFEGACQQMKRMLLQVPDAPAVAVEILSGLKRTEIVLISCATVVAGQCFLDMVSGVDPESWTAEERAAFTRKFTSSAVGNWAREDILNDWKELAKVS